MDIILTLVVRERDSKHLTEVQAAVSKHQHPTEVKPLSPASAVDIVYSNGDLATIERIAGDSVADRPVDFLVSRAEGRRKKLLIADMDSTVITSETLDDMAAHVGLKEEIAAITARSMRGELDLINRFGNASA